MGVGVLVYMLGVLSVPQAVFAFSAVGCKEKAGQGEEGIKPGLEQHAFPIVFPIRRLMTPGTAPLFQSPALPVNTHYPLPTMEPYSAHGSIRRIVAFQGSDTSPVSNMLPLARVQPALQPGGLA